MAKSKARKLREKLEREGRRNPEFNRGSWNGINPLTKKTPSLIEKKRKVYNKHKKRNYSDKHGQGDSAFYYAS